MTRYVATWPGDYRSNPDGLLVLFTLLTKRTVTAAQMAPILQKDIDEAEFVLHQLAAAPLELTERTRHSARRREGVYRLRGPVIAQLGAAVRYHTRTTDDTDRKVTEIVTEAGQINSKMVRTLLDVDTATASRVLADLVARGVLAKTSSAQRGPGVTYGPGPRFPQPKTRARGPLS